MIKDGEHRAGRPCDRCYRPGIKDIDGAWLCLYCVDNAVPDSKQAAANEGPGSLKAAPTDLLSLHNG